jgi:hypothetical protein
VTKQMEYPVPRAEGRLQTAVNAAVVGSAAASDGDVAGRDQPFRNRAADAAVRTRQPLHVFARTAGGKDSSLLAACATRARFQPRV